MVESIKFIIFQNFTIGHCKFAFAVKHTHGSASLSAHVSIIISSIREKVIIFRGHSIALNLKTEQSYRFC